MIPRNRKTTAPMARTGVVSFVLLAAIADSFAESPHDRHGHAKSVVAPAPSEAPKTNQAKTESGPQHTNTEAEKYCANIATSTDQAVSFHREQQLRELESQIEQRVKELDAKRAEVQRLIDASEAILAKADQSLVDLYSKMKPDAAASQIAKLDDDIAVALLVHIKTKEMSAIMDEMDAERAAALAKKLSQKIRAGKDEKPK